MQHFEEAGVHSGDSACCLPPHTLSDDVQARIREQTAAMGRELNVQELDERSVRGEERQKSM